MSTTEPLLYQRVAGLVAGQISSGALRGSERIPSVRSMSRAARVSVSTVVQAYARLESLGLIEARPQSGYFVRARERERLPEPPPRQLRSTRPRSVAADVLDACREAMQRTDLVQLNMACAPPESAPNRRLNVLIREELRGHPNHAGEILLPPGDFELRRQVARRAAVAGAPANPDDIVITGGTMDAVTLALGVLCKAGDTVLVESPTYFGVLQAVEHLGLKVVEVPNHPGRGIDVDAIRGALRNAAGGQRPAAAVLMPNFNNPSGSLTPADAKRALVALLAGAGVPIIEDDLYGELHFGSEHPASLRAFDPQGLVISCGSVSKTIALGYRVGWAITPAWAADIQRAKFFTSVAAPTLQQRVLARYFASGGYDRFLTGLRRMLAESAERFLDAIASTFPPGTCVARPAGGMVLWVRLPPGVDSMELFRTALARRIGIMPGIVFSAKAGYRNYIRLNYGCGWSADIAAAIETLGRLVRRMADASGRPSAR
jgi:DNA-binding transcriptional MocR family regulator